MPCSDYFFEQSVRAIGPREVTRRVLWEFCFPAISTSYRRNCFFQCGYSDNNEGRLLEATPRRINLFICTVYGEWKMRPNNLAKTFTSFVYRFYNFGWSNQAWIDFRGSMSFPRVALTDPHLQFRASVFHWHSELAFTGRRATDRHDYINHHRR